MVRKITLIRKIIFYLHFIYTKIQRMKKNNKKDITLKTGINISMKFPGSVKDAM